MNANRRLQERKLPERIVLCKLGGEESSFVLNLSEDGLGFESHTPVEKTGVLQLRLSAGVNGEIETTGQLAWIDSAKRTGGLRFLELSAPAREQIREWLSDNSTPSSETNAGTSLQKYDKQALAYPLTYQPAADKLATYKPVLWQQMGVPSTQLVPIERHQAQKRRQFLAGVLVGFAICAAVMIPIFRYAGGTKSGSMAWTTTASANRAAQSHVEQTQASAVQSVLPSASTTEQAATKPLATDPGPVQKVSVAAPTRSPQSLNQKQRPPSAGASSTNPMTRTSSPSATPQPAKPAERVASSRPSAEAQPLEANQAAVVPTPAASKPHSSSGPVEGQVEGPMARPMQAQVQHPKKAPPTLQQLWAALQAGNVKAAVALADLYSRGDGVPQNCQQARVLLQVASAKKNAEASRKLQQLDQGGCPANTDNQ